MAKAKYMIADVDEAAKAVEGVKRASDEVRAVCKVITDETQKVSQLNATFSTNTQVANRYDQLNKSLGDICPMLDDTAATVDKLVKQSRAALEQSKGKKI